MTGHAERWHALLKDADGAPCAALAERMRADRLTFGGRLLCPFLRPFFLDAADEARVRTAAETLWTIGERVARAAFDDRTLLDDLALTDDEVRLASIDPRYPTTSTAGRADAFLLPDSLQFAEYNAESPAGFAYTQGLGELFLGMPEMRRFQDATPLRMYRPVEQMRQALLASYREWGGTASPPLVAIVDWREVPTYTEFELLRDAFTAAGTPTIVCDPRDLEFSNGALTAAGRRIDLVYRRVLINDIVARPDECRPLVSAYERGAVCVANSLRCKIPHKKAFFAVLTDARRSELFSEHERSVIRQHIPWTALVREGRVTRQSEQIDLLEHIRNRREQLVIKPNDEYGGSGVTLGWETSASEWDDAIQRALRGADGAWVVQEKITVRRETFPMCVDSRVEMRDMLVDFAPYLFRGRLAGFLTRLSATGLANVTSGGGQVPAFVVEGRIG
jgi:uncharacterized circularly permuted ATP-grasp superfamily protein